MAQQSILGRIAQLARANINALIDAAEDPEKMLDQMIRDYINSISEAEEAVAQTIGNLRMMEEDPREAGKAAADWGAKAAAAAGKAKELRAGEHATEADRFENLARVALKRQITFEEQVGRSRHAHRPADRRRREAEERAQHDARQARGAEGQA